jgi:GTP pyrophosphokinase
LGEIAGIFGYQKANIINLRLSARDQEFHTFEIDLEVHDLGHLMRIISALRSSESVAQADRVYG